MQKMTVAIIGSANIGADLMLEIMRLLHRAGLVQMPLPHTFDC
jgi:acetaldehyde dehydrogenase (acetylating)